MKSYACYALLVMFFHSSYVVGMFSLRRFSAVSCQENKLLSPEQLHALSVAYHGQGICPIQPNAEEQWIGCKKKCSERLGSREIPPALKINAYSECIAGCFEKYKENRVKEERDATCRLCYL